VTPGPASARSFNACDYLLDRHVRAGRGDRLALTGVAGDISYADLAERVKNAARSLRRLGLQAEQRVVMVMTDSPEFVIVYLAAMRIGAGGRHRPRPDRRAGRQAPSRPGPGQPAAHRYGDGAQPPSPDAAPSRPAPAQVTEHGVSGLRTLLSRSTAEVRPGTDSGGAVELPGGARLVRCGGRPATALAAEWGVPVVVVDRALDDATATGIAVAASDGCPAAAADEAVGLLQAAAGGSLI
jgi:hypothetical protein